MRNQIMMAAMEEIGETGIKFTMSDLTRRLAISKTTLYAHFRSKEELIGAILDALLENVRQQEEEVIKNDSLTIPEKIIALIKIHPTVLLPVSSNFLLTLKRQFPNEWKKGEQNRDHKWQLIEMLIIQGIDEGCFRAIDLTITKVVFTATTNQLGEPSFLIENNLTYKNAIDKAADIFYFGICGNKI